jgi:UDP-N-acetylmuramate dehydrogenase
VGGPARYGLETDDADQAAGAIADAARAGLPVLCLGGGSNLLVADDGFDGLVVKYTADDFEVIERSDSAGDGILTAAAGATIANLARRLARLGWAGLEWASNVPGTIGGAAVNNAGAFGSCLAECLLDLELIDAAGRRRVAGNGELDYAYRSSLLKRGDLGPVLVTRVRCAVHRDDPAAALARIADCQAQRTATQPRQLSAGSVFANPPGDYAGRLIEAVGLKDTRIGGCAISAQHANFIVNVGRGTASDVYGLVRLAQDAVWSGFGIWLQPEIQLVGGWTPDQLGLLHGPTPPASVGVA